MNPPLVFETIRIQGGEAFNLGYHQARMERTSLALYSTKLGFQLTDILTPPNDTSLYRCKVLYRDNSYQVTYTPYIPQKLKRFKVVHSSIDYSYKYLHREKLNHLKVEGYDDIFIEKENLLTDTTIANIALFKENTWYTPKKPLLQGTMRAKLLDEGLLVTTNIPSSSLHTYSKVALMNAMIGFSIIEDFTIDR
jgi:4-amino-4-deoxychorismate lyase